MPEDAFGSRLLLLRLHLRLNMRLALPLTTIVFGLVG
jgi:hypothetical protein